MKSKPTYQELEKENEILRQKLEIRENSEKIQAYFDYNKAIMLHINSVTTQIINANEAAVNFYGYSKNELLQKTINDLNTLPPDKISIIMKEVVNSKSNFFEFQHKLSNGKIKDVEVYVSPFNTDDETYMIATVLDITKRKKAEQNLKRYKKIANLASEHMSFIDTDYVYQSVNDAYLNAHEKTEDQIIGRSIAEFFGDEVFESSIKQKIDACFTGETIKYQKWLDFKGLGKRYMNISYYPYLENNKIIGLIVDSSDITEWQKARQAVIKENQRFKKILDINPAGIYIVDKQYNIEYVNPTIKKEFGEVDGRKCYLYFHDLPEACTWCKNKEVFAGKSVRWEWFSEKSKKYYDLFDIPIKNPDGTISKFEIFFDITGRKKAEQALKESNATKDKFFSIISHDLRSPFNSMLGFSELLNDNFEKYDIEKKKQFVSIINQGLQETYKLLENLLTWSHSQRGIINFKPEKINLYLFIKESSQLLKQSAENKSIKLTNQIDKNIYIEVDKDMLSTIIRNLISNAIKFTPKGGKISIDAKNKQQFIEITVKDNGIGIPKEIQSKLFDIGENTSTEGTENETGTGLGLILCKEFVEKHGGKIWVESEIEKGSKFNFS